jgi:hypothetical protein
MIRMALYIRVRKDSGYSIMDPDPVCCYLSFGLLLWLGVVTAVEDLSQPPSEEVGHHPQGR